MLTPPDWMTPPVNAGTLLGVAAGFVIASRRQDHWATVAGYTIALGFAAGSVYRIVMARGSRL